VKKPKNKIFETNCTFYPCKLVGVTKNYPPPKKTPKNEKPLQATFLRVFAPPFARFEKPPQKKPPLAPDS